MHRDASVESREVLVVYIGWRKAVAMTALAVVIGMVVMTALGLSLLSLLPPGVFGG